MAQEHNHPDNLLPAVHHHGEVLPGGGQPYAYPNGDAGKGAGYPSEQDDPESEGILEYIRAIKRRKGTLILFTALGLLCAILITLPQTPIYQAKTSIEIQDVNDNFLGMKQVQQFSEMPTTTMTDIQTQIKILQSDTLSERVIANLKATKAEQLATEPSRINAWRKALNLPDEQPVDAQTAALKYAAKNLKVRAAGQTRIIEILADSTDPKIAAAFCNSLTSEFIDQNVEARYKASQRTGDWLGRQMDDMRIRLERSEDALQAYARKTGLLFTSDKNNVSDDKLKQLQLALSAAQADRVTKQSRFEMATNSPPEALPDVLNDSSLRDYQTKLTDLRRQQAELASTFTDKHPKVKRLAPQIQTLETALTRERGAILKRISNEYEEAQRREKLLEEDYRVQASLVTDQGEKSIHYNILKREVDSNRQLYESMLQRVKETTIASAMRASNVRVVDLAKAPRLPYKPDPLVNGGLGLLAGFFIGIAYIVTTDRANRTLQDPGDAAYYLGIPELGIIPARLNTPGEKKKRKLQLLLAEGAKLPEEKTLPDKWELVTLQDKPSMLAESFRSTLTSILFSGQNGTRPRMLVITSGGAAEGKSSIVSNLAIALAEIGKRVLVVDADTRKPRIADIFEISNKVGLTNLLRDNPAADSEELTAMIQETGIPNLFVLPSGPTVMGSTNLLYASNLTAYLSRFKAEYDMVLIDTPPMLQIADARVLGRLVDAVVLVVRAGQTTRDAAMAAKERLATDGIRLLGTVLNDWNPKMSKSGYYGYYSGYHYRGSYKGYSNYYRHEKGDEKS